MVGFDADRASVMMGQRGGVSALIKRETFHTLYPYTVLHTGLNLALKML